MAKLRRGLMGLFAIFFLLSGLALVQLILDEQHDLSSRAASWIVDPKRLPIEQVNYFVNEYVWSSEERSGGLPLKVDFDAGRWSAPKAGSKVFSHAFLPITVRFVNGELDNAKLANLLGASFKVEKKGVVVGDISADWNVVSYKGKFVKEEVLVEQWMRKDGVVAVAVYPHATDREEVIKLLGGVTVSEMKTIKVKGATDSRNDDVRIAVLSRPSVVMILTRYCNSLKWKDVEGVLASREYKYCTAGVGSGFFVNPEGYVGTNGHVVRVPEPIGITSALKAGGFKDLAADVLTILYQQMRGAVPTVEEIKTAVDKVYSSEEGLVQLYGVMMDLRTKGVLAEGTGDYKYYVQLSDEPLRWDKSGMVTASDKVLTAQFVDANFDMNLKDDGFKGSDVALLKVEGKNFPALPLGTADNLEVADTIQVLGFPAVASSFSSGGSWLLDSSSNAEPSVTKGVVSAFKNAKGDMKRLIQTDASINHGNSGGPAVNNKGEVVGIATYGLALSGEDSGGNFNFLRDVADLKELMAKDKVTGSTVGSYDDWKMGLESYWLSYFKYAKGDFEKVLGAYPVHPTVDKYLSEAKAKVGSKEDLTPKFTRAERKTYTVAAAAGMGVSILLFVTMVIWEIVDNNKHKKLLAGVGSSPTTF